MRTPREQFAYMGYSLRTDQWRYTFWARWEPTMHPVLSEPAGEELYDHRLDTAPFDVDDFEYKNLADDPEHVQVKAELRQQLVATVGSWQKEG